DVSVLLGKGKGTFAPQVDYAAGPGPSAVVVADLNGDGELDLVVANISTGNKGALSVLLNQGNATFAPAVSYTAGVEILSIATADLNGDGELDIVFVNAGGLEAGVLMNQGNGTFAPPSGYGVSFDPQGIVAADLNGDGHIDLAVADISPSGVSVFLSQ